MLKSVFQEIKKYPSAIFGLSIIALLLMLSVYTIVALPYSTAIELWRGSDGVWDENPRNAPPAWINLFPGYNLPVTIIRHSLKSDGIVETERLGDGMVEKRILFDFDYAYDGFPQEINIFLDASYASTRPYVEFEWVTPDDRAISLGNQTINRTDTFRVSQDRRLERQLGRVSPHIGLFANPDIDELTPLHGPYKLLVTILLFEEDANAEAKLVVYGQAHGIAGTDNRRRDLSVALLWGAPISLAIGFVAAVFANVLTMFFAAFGVWYGGWIDQAIQRITEVNLILPVLPILIMVGTFYSRSIWVMIGVVVLLSIFGGGIKSFRAIFLQVKESPYIEASKAYGAGNFRIITRYLMPRVIPILVPGFVIQIPSFVFLEATLALLGLGDPTMPTWGKLLSDGYYGGALYNGYYYWVLEPAALLMLTGLGFAMLGFALDRIFNPRLRGM